MDFILLIGLINFHTNWHFYELIYTEDMHALYISVPHEVKNQRALVKRTSQIMKNGQDITIQIGSGTGAPNRVYIPCKVQITITELKDTNTKPVTM